MAEELQDLITKIQEEGVKAAEEKARSIEEEAQKKADAILNDAKKEAENLIEDAKNKIAKMEESGKELLKQAGRDLMLSLKKEINKTLDQLVISQVRESLKPADMAEIIKGLIGKDKSEKKDIVISLSEKDADKVEKSLLKELGTEIKEGINLKPREDIRGGFLISYDKGKSHYDFSDKALAEYLSSYVKPKLSEMLKDISPEKKKENK